MSVSDVSVLLLTGASGLLGQQIALALADSVGSGRLWVASRTPSASAVAGLAALSSRQLAIDLADPALELPANIGTLIHAAGEKSDPVRMTAVNHTGTRRLAEAAARAGVRRFVHVSSVGVYGAGARAGSVDPSFPKHPRNLYESSKAAGEASVREVCNRSGMEWVVLQPSNVVAALAVHAAPLLGLLSAIQRRRFTWFGAGDGWLNYIAVEDVAAAVVEAALHGPADATFILNTPQRLEQVVQWCVQLLALPVPSRRVPLWAGRAAAGVGDAAASLGWSLPLDSNRLRELTTTTHYDGSALHRATGFEYPLGVQAMLARLVGRYRREGRL